MKHVISCILLGFLMVSVVSARHKKRPQIPKTIKVLDDKARATKLYIPAQENQVHSTTSGTYAVYPYLSQKDDASVHFSLRVKYLDFLALMDSTWNCQSATVTIDGGDEVHLDLNQSNVNTNSDGRTASFDFHGLEIEPLVRRLASTTGAWLVLGYQGGPRKEVHFNQEDLGIFRMVVLVGDALKSTSNRESGPSAVKAK